jgi:hypothetical protein
MHVPTSELFQSGTDEKHIRAGAAMLQLLVPGGRKLFWALLKQIKFASLAQHCDLLDEDLNLHKWHTLSSQYGLLV